MRGDSTEPSGDPRRDNFMQLQTAARLIDSTKKGPPPCQAADRFISQILTFQDKKSFDRARTLVESHDRDDYADHLSIGGYARNSG